MKTSTLFGIGLLAGAALVFGIRAALLGTSAAAEPAAAENVAGRAGDVAHDDMAHATHARDTAEERKPAPEAPSIVVVRLDDAGQIVAAVMEMPGGSSHEVSPGGHAPMGDYPARIEGSASQFTAHLHPHEDGTLEVTLRDADGAVMAEGVLAAKEERAPENAICPVMGNPVDPAIYIDFEGRRIGFCCAGCDEEFKKDPEKYLKKVDAELAGKETK